MRRDDITSLVVNSTIAAAAALIAEADAHAASIKQFIIQGLHHDWKICQIQPARLPNWPKLKKREDYYWFLDYASQIHIRLR